LGFIPILGIGCYYNPYLSTAWLHFEKENLLSGTYIFLVRTKGTVIGTGNIIIEVI
jgi:hypothetical protein